MTWLRSGLLASLIVALAAAAGTAAQANDTNNTNQDAGTVLNVTAHDDEGFYFMVEGLEGKNPTIELTPGLAYMVHFENEGATVHNLHFGSPVNESTEVIGPGENRTLAFTVGADLTGAGQYWCDPHREQGMVGDLQFGAAEAGGPDGVPGFGALLALGAVAAAGVVLARVRR